MRFPTCLLLSAAFASTPALAEPFKLKPIIDTRLRYESVDQDPIIKDADALTFRARIGAEASNERWSILVEGEATGAIVEHYNSGVNLKAQYPIIADPENVELNRAQVQFRGLAKTLITLGRQRINLDDQRFVGSVGWRQNEQTFDAVRIEWTGVPKLKTDITYAWSDRTIWGIDGLGARQQAISGDNFFANISYATPIGALTGFAYLVDQDEAAVSGFQLSSQTYGMRLSGARPLSKRVKLSYVASYARQSDYHRNPNDYQADYWLIDGGLEVDSLRIGAGYEVLGADNGVALTSFQTPLATLHKFQGWADKFLTTPPNGIRDLYGSVGYTAKKVLGTDTVTFQAAYHRFDSDRLDVHYGNEINLLVSVKVKRFTVSAKFADYDARSFLTNTRKAWLQLEWAY